MDLQPAPLPGKLRPVKSKINRRTIQENKTSSKEAPIHRQKRVFGTSRSTNVPIKTVAEKPVIKPTIGFSRQQSKPSRENSFKPRDKQDQPFTESKLVVAEASTNDQIKTVEKNSFDETKARSKKSVCFQEPLAGNLGKIVHTPVSSSIKPRVLGTPYYSAENCGKCRIHTLESSSYWLAQIKLAESVEKHFVSATFFRLAFETNAEPVRSLRVELQRYMARHGSLSRKTEWRDVSLSYGLLKDESNVVGLDSALEKADKRENSAGDLDQQQKYLKELTVEKAQTSKSELKDGLEIKELVEGIENRGIEQGKVSPGMVPETFDTEATVEN